MARNKRNEESETFIFRYPLAHRCVATHTDNDQDSTRCGLMRLLNLLCSCPKFLITGKYPIEVNDVLDLLEVLYKPLSIHSSHIYENYCIIKTFHDKVNTKTHLLNIRKLSLIINPLQTYLIIIGSRPLH